ncbi:MAG: response regulator [bacterium]|nr:response regulator [bacterium]
MRKILIIDDSFITRRHVRKLLEAADCVVDEAVNGQEGLDTVAEIAYDCIVLDLLMPIMDGQTFLANFRLKDKTTPVIVVTSDIQNSTRAECKGLGASAFIHKPSIRDELLPTMDDLIKEPAEHSV